MTSDTDTLTHVDDVLELAALERPTWPTISAAIPDWHPRNEGDDGEDDDDEPDPEPKSKTPEELQAEVDKWRALSKKHEGRSKQNAKAAEELAELKKQDQTELERATDKLTAAEQRADKAEAALQRIEVALEKAPDGMPLSKVRALSKRLTGDSREDLESDADELFADFKPAEGDDGDEPSGDPSRRPRERLRPGAAPGAEPEETDPDKLAATVPRAY